MNPDELAEIHRLSFLDAPRPWAAAEFVSLLESSSVELFLETGGFALCRIAGPEAELLTIAVHPDFRRQGIGQKLLTELHRFAKASGADDIFLEVSAKNPGAKALYENSGYSTQGRRKDYYILPNGQKNDALVMRCSF